MLFRILAHWIPLGADWGRNLFLLLRLSSGAPTEETSNEAYDIGSGSYFRTMQHRGFGPSRRQYGGWKLAVRRHRREQGQHDDEHSQIPNPRVELVSALAQVLRLRQREDRDAQVERSGGPQR